MSSRNSEQQPFQTCEMAAHATQDPAPFATCTVNVNDAVSYVVCPACAAHVVAATVAPGFDGEILVTSVPHPDEADQPDPAEVAEKLAEYLGLSDECPPDCPGPEGECPERARRGRPGDRGSCSLCWASWAADVPAIFTTATDPEACPACGRRHCECDDAEALGTTAADRAQATALPAGRSAP